MLFISMFGILLLFNNDVPHCFKGTLSNTIIFMVTEIFLKMMKNAFYFTLKLVLFSGYLNFCPNL